MTPNAPISLKQLARMANVSTATVSRVLNNKGRFSEETRDLVLGLIRETGYAPNVAAKALRTRTARAIGLVVPDIVNEFFSHIIDALSRFFFKNDYSLFVCNAGEDADKNRALITNLLGKGVDGLIYISRFPLDVRGLSIPVVCLDRLPDDENVAMVGSDNFGGGVLAAKALVEAGSRRMVVVCDPADRGLSTIDARVEGFARGLAECGVDWDPRRDIIHSPMTVADARRNVAAAVRAGRRFDGVFASMDLGALGTIFGLEDAGLRVPDDVNVVGFDDISISEYFRPSLTTVRQDTAAMAEAGADMLLAIMEGGQARRRQMRIPVTLVRRGSTRV